MRTLRFSTWTRLSFAALLLAASLLMAPAPAPAQVRWCCGFYHQTIYYADEAMTQSTGWCGEGCGDPYTCTGTTGPYQKTRTICCPCEW